jgi:hypothetical protein
MSNSNHRLDFEEVLLRVEAVGWEAVYSRVPELTDAINANAKSKSKLTACPKHGASGSKSSKFRLFADWRQTGGGIHNDFGGFKGGAALLMWLRDWDYATSMYFIADSIGMKVDVTKTHKKYQEKRQDMGLYDPNEQAARNQAVAAVSHGVSNAKSIDYAAMTTEELLVIQKQRQAAELERQVVEDDRRRKSLKRISSESMPMTAPEAEPARLYFASRGLLFKEYPSELRFHPNLAYFDEEVGKITGFYPGVIAIVRNLDGEPVTIHRIYLTAEGKKAPVAEEKKMMSAPSNKPVSGSAIRLSQWAVGKTLHLAEGIETAVAVMLRVLACEDAQDHAVWSTINATLLEAIHIPQGVEQVVIWADHDKSLAGVNHAKALKERLISQGIKASIFLPKGIIPDDKKGIDWLDKLKDHGLDGLPDTSYVRLAMAQVHVSV